MPATFFFKVIRFFFFKHLFEIIIDSYVVVRKDRDPISLASISSSGNILHNRVTASQSRN